MPRSSWKGYLKLSLVSCPVALFPAISSRERVSFHVMNRDTGNRTKYLVVDSETQEPVDSENRVRGYEVAKNQYVYVEDDEIDAVKIDSTHTIDIDNFVPRDQVDEMYLDTPYYLAPDDKIGEEAYLVIREAMEKEHMVGVARIVMARRERMLMIEPRGKGLLATTLRNANEVRSDEAYFEGISDMELPDEMLSIATDIIERKSAKFDPKKFQDRYEQALVALIESKRSGKAAPAPSAPPQRQTINLMEALRRSLEGETGSSARSASSSRRPSQARTAARSSRRPHTKKSTRRAS
ncbi:Ku protein [Leptospira interrogans]